VFGGDVRIDEQVVNGFLEAVAGDERDRRVALRIEIDQERLELLLRQRCSKVDRGRRLSNPPFWF
jgi:hypothetical protein